MGRFLAREAGVGVSLGGWRKYKCRISARSGPRGVRGPPGTDGAHLQRRRGSIMEVRLRMATLKKRCRARNGRGEGRYSAPIGYAGPSRCVGPRPGRGDHLQGQGRACWGVRGHVCTRSQDQGGPFFYLPTHSDQKPCNARRADDACTHWQPDSSRIACDTAGRQGSAKLIAGTRALAR